MSESALCQSLVAKQSAPKTNPVPSAAKILSVSEGFLAQDRHRRTGLVPFIKIGKCVRYKISDLVAVLENGTHQPDKVA